MSDADIDNLERYIIAKVDPEIKIGEYSAKELSTKNSYNSWMKTNCHERQYSFQVKKCQDPRCLPKKSDVEFNWVPDPMFADEKKENYQPFEKAYGTETTEKYCPSTSVESIVALAEKEQGCKNKELTAQRVRSVVNCFVCKKNLDAFMLRIN